MEYQDYKYVSYNVDTIGYNKDKIKTKSFTLNNVVYNVLNNDSSCITFDDCNLRLYRSVVTDENSNILCFSPPNSIELDKFQEKYPELNENIYVNQIIEGTMINLFYDERIKSWELSTRSSVAGNSWFYRTQYVFNDENDNNNQKTKQKTFRDMFLECLKIENNVLENEFLDNLPKQYTYSFVIQHPDNHIVLNITEPRVYLVSVYEKSNIDGHRIVYIPPTVYEHWDVFNNSVIEFPSKYLDSSYDSLKNNYCSIHTDYSTMGIMITNICTGERASMSNPVYEEVKKIRGNNPNLQYHYFCLERIGKKEEFLQYFPMYSKIFANFGRQYNEFITNVHQSYFSFYVKKEGIPIAKKYFIHASRIHHQIFLPSINEEKKIITRKVVKEYFDNLTPNEILYYLNYDKRQASKIEKNISVEL